MIMIMAVLLGLLGWVVDAALDYAYFNEQYNRTFFQLLLTDVPGHEIYIRLAGMTSLILFGLIMTSLLARRRRDELRINHLNRVLVSIRNVNQLIIREKNSKNLLKKACSLLTENRGYFSTWILILGDKGKIDFFTGSNLGDEEDHLKAIAASGKLPLCARRALETPSVLAIGEPSRDCPDCPALHGYNNRAAFCCQISHDNHIYGVMTATIARNRIDDAEEQALFHEIAGDLGFALHSLEQETRQKEMELNLLQHREWLATTLKSIGDAVIAVDLNKRITFMNPVAEKLTGYKNEEALGRPLDDIFKILNEETRQAAPHPVERVLRDGVIVGLANHTVLISRDGREIPIDDSGAPIRDSKNQINGVVLVFHDVTEQRRAERELRESRETFHNLFHNAQVGLFRTRISDGLILESNEQLARMFGYDSAQDFINVYMTEGNYVDPDARQKMITLLRETGEVIGFEAEFRRRDGKSFWARYSARIYPEQGWIEGVAEDISEWKKTQEHLRQSQEKVRAFIDTVDDFVYFQALDGSITFINNAVVRLTGYTPEDFAQDPLFWKKIVEPDSLKVIEDFFKSHPDGTDFWEAEYRLTVKDGQVRRIYSRMYGARDAAGKFSGYYCVDRDITEKIKAEEALRRSEATLSSIFRAAPIGLGMVTNRVFDWVNDEIIKMTGYSHRELKGQSARMLYPSQEEFDRVGKLKYADIHITGAGSILTRWKRKDGTMIDILLSSSALNRDNLTAGVVFAVLDITDRKRAEEALAAEKERLDVTLKSIGDAVVATDTNGNILIFNQVAEELTGWTYEDALGQPVEKILEFLDLNTREPLENPIKRVMNTNSRITIPQDVLMISRDGQEKLIEDSAAPIREKRGRLIGAVLVFRDVTESRRLREFATRAQRLETAGRIAGQVAHDFNNLLAPLTAYPDLIRMDIPAGHQSLKFLDDIERSANQMAEINQQLLTLGRRGHYNQEPLNLNNIVAQVLNQIRPVPDSLIISCHLQDNLMLLKGGAAQIHRLLLNLVNNAREAMNDVGQLTLNTDNFYVDLLAGRYGRIPQGEYVKLTVSDTGTGISPEIMAKIFDPFFTTKSSDKKRGSGLGLSVVHAVIEDHNGFIDVASTPGEGTSFYVYFPITRENLRLQSTEEITGGKERILVVDDDHLQLEVCGRLLENLGYQASTVSSGEEALDYIVENPQDLIILDMIMLDGIDGTETLRRILEILPDQKAILVSGYASSERVEEALRLGAGEFIRKPLSLKSIAQAVRRELDRKPVRRHQR